MNNNLGMFFFLVRVLCVQVQHAAELIQKVSEVEKPAFWVTKVLKYLDDKFIVTIERCIWEKMKRTLGSLLLL